LRKQDTGEMVNWKKALIAHRPGENNNQISTIRQLLKLSPDPSKRISKRFL